MTVKWGRARGQYLEYFRYSERKWTAAAAAATLFNNQFLIFPFTVTLLMMICCLSRVDILDDSCFIAKWGQIDFFWRRQFVFPLFLSPFAVVLPLAYLTFTFPSIFVIIDSSSTNHHQSKKKSRGDQLEVYFGCCDARWGDKGDVWSVFVCAEMITE